MKQMKSVMNSDEKLFVLIRWISSTILILIKIVANIQLWKLHSYFRISKKV